MCTCTSVPIKLSDASIQVPATAADCNCQTSTCQCSQLLQAMKDVVYLEHALHNEFTAEAHTEHRNRKQEAGRNILAHLKRDMDTKEKRCLECLQKQGMGTWLAATPNFSCGNVLSSQEFRDELRNRHGMELLNAPSECDGCGSKFSISYSLSCKSWRFSQFVTLCE